MPDARHRFSRHAVATLTLLAGTATAQPDRVEYGGFDGPGHDQHIVLLSGDEEYRSEQALPQLGKILAVHHGFSCTVLFAIDPDTGCIAPNRQDHIPGLEALATADLLVIATRFRNLPDADMERIDAYLRAGRPVLGLRTATHAFQIPAERAFAHYGNGYDGARTEWHGGFGRLVLGEQWISHHGAHGSEATRGMLVADAAAHPILRGLADGAVFGPTDVYGVRLPLPDDSCPLVLGQVVAGMTPDAAPVAGAKNEPMLPIAWTKSYQIPGGERGRAFTTTMGAATDLLAEGTRRLLVNAAYWCVGREADIPPGGCRVDLVGDYAPDAYGFRGDDDWRQRHLRVEAQALALAK